MAGFLTEDRTKWSGTATELAAALGLDMKPNTLSMRLNVNVDRLRDEYGVAYEATRSHAGRKIMLSRMTASA